MRPTHCLLFDILCDVHRVRIGQNNDKYEIEKKITSIPRNQSVNKYIKRTCAYTYMSTPLLHKSIGIKGVKPIRNSGNTQRNNLIAWDQNMYHHFCPFRGAQLLSRECYRYVRLDTVNRLIVRPRSSMGMHVGVAER